MITGPDDRRARPLAWSSIASILLHAAAGAVLAVLFLRYLNTGHNAAERLSETTVVTIEHVEPSPTPTPVPTPTPSPTPLTAGATAGQRPTRSITVTVPVQHATPNTQSRLVADEKVFAKQVAALNAQNDPHAIPTIDPAAAPHVAKNYGFTVPSGMSSGNEGNGVITTTQSWHDGGRDCYYGRYSFVYGDGSTESGSIVWPFCYDPGDDPFHQGRHEIPFPPPLPGFRLPPGTDLPPLEKSFYEHWIAEQ